MEKMKKAEDEEVIDEQYKAIATMFYVNILDNPLQRVIYERLWTALQNTADNPDHKEK